MYELINVKMTPQQYFAQINKQTAERSIFLNSGLVTRSPAYDLAANGTGFSANFPHIDAISNQEAESLTGSAADKLVPLGLSQDGTKVPIARRAQGWGILNLTNGTTGARAVNAVLGNLGGYWGRDLDKAAMAVLRGSVSANLAGTALAGETLVNDITSETGDAAVFNKDLFYDTLALLGDASKDATHFVAHSDLIHYFRKTEDNDFVPASKTDIKMDTYKGKIVVETDTMVGDAAGEYLATFIRPGEAIYGRGNYLTATGEPALATTKDELAGNGGGSTTIVSREQYCVGMNSFSFNGTAVAGAHPTNAELADPDNWSVKATERKQIGIAAMKFRLEAE